MPSPAGLTFETVEEARALLARYLRRTRLRRSGALSRINGADVFLKLETELPTGSFKPRGALWALSRRMSRGPVREVTASSTGNHGAAVAFAARQMGVPARIFLPANPNPVKRAKIAALGAVVVEGGRDGSEAYSAAAEYSGAGGIYFLDDASDPDVTAGPATIACEILDQAPQVRRMYVPMGDTALVRGVAFAAKHRQPEVRVIGVQAATAPSYFLSWRENRVVETESCETIADGLATRTPREANVRAIRELVDEVRLVSDAAMLAAMRFLYREEGVRAAPAGAAAAAAFLAADPVGQPAALLVTGGNVADDVWSLAMAPPAWSTARGVRL